MLKSFKQYGSKFVDGLKNDEDSFYEFNTSKGENAAWIAGNVMHYAGVSAIGAAAILGVLWEYRWIHGNLKVFDKGTNAWYDFKALGEYNNRNL